MNCNQVQESFSDDSVGLLDAETKSAMEAHIAGCAPCAAEHRRFRRCLELLDHSTRPVPPPDLWQGIRARMDLERSISSSPMPPPRTMPRDTWWSGLLTAAAGFAVVFGIFNLSARTDQSTAAAQPSQAAATVSVSTGMDLNNPLVDGASVYALESMRLDPAREVELKRIQRERSGSQRLPGENVR